MVKKLFIVAALTALVLSGCSGQASAQAPTSTATEAPAPAATEVIATEVPVDAPATNPPVDETLATATPPPTEAIPPTQAIERPANAPDCTNSASFVADVTMPDNSDVGAGSKFTKTWRVSNTGTCIWGPDYTLAPYSEEQLGSPAALALAITYPGQTLDISVDLTAPNSLGKHRGNFVIKNAAGLIMKINDDSRLWVIINVTTAAATSNVADATAAPAPTSGSSASDSSSGTGFANVTCAFATEAIRVTDVINAINAYRAQNGLTAYTVSTQLTAAAQAHANDMACNQLFYHTGSNGSTPQTRVAASGYVASAITENVYGSYPPLTGQDAVNWWINDKTDLNHNRNLLSTDYKEIGVGYSFFNNYGYYVVVFAKP